MKMGFTLWARSNKHTRENVGSQNIEKNSRSQRAEHQNLCKMLEKIEEAEEQNTRTLPKCRKSRALELYQKWKVRGVKGYM